MLFDEKRLQMESATQLIQCPIHTVEPFALMLAPVYVLMKLNQKFVSVKAPLDFFTQEELDRLKNYGVFFLPKFVNASVKFQTAARLVKNILTIKQDMVAASTPEISGECFKVLAPLWGKQIRIEPFFMSVFADELCESLNPEKMLFARENAVVRHDHGILLSGAAVFVALHLGWLDYTYLNQLRQEVYSRTVEGEEWSEPKSEMEYIVSDLYREIVMNRHLDESLMIEIGSEWSMRLASRLSRVKTRNSNSLEDSATIRGDSGFVA